MLYSMDRLESMAISLQKIGVHLEISGIVQGVGFRPFVHRKVTDCSLCGNIRNTFDGVELYLEGNEENILKFLEALKTEAPKPARIGSISISEYEAPKGLTDFSILESDRQGRRNTLISPDLGICPDCLRELRDPEDRRFRYPFLNCTNCGPRFTIIRDVPYDRKNTSMGNFPMCKSCASEYADINDRRYHAQPDCCEDCGPMLKFISAGGAPDRAPENYEAILAGLELIEKGGILAVKGLGGFHLCCRIDLPETVNRLRSRKQRDGKPFAVMCADLAEARKYVNINPSEEALLDSPAKPIVLLELKDGMDNAFAGITDNGRLGVMLPYTPLHALLFDSSPVRTMIMTSANLSDIPVLSDNEAALSALAGIADGFLLHDRGIVTKCDDSVLWEFEGQPYFARRSRGYAPAPVRIPDDPRMILACGAEQKASFCMNRGSCAFPGQHIGDLKNTETLDFYESQIRNFENLFDINPQALACDLHPDYLSTAFAEKMAKDRGLPLVRVQHHHAHMASCMADNGIGFTENETCLGIIWDGTGLGTDGTIWGSEFLLGDYREFERLGSLRPVRLPGGDRCMEEIWRTAVSLMDDAGLPAEIISSVFSEDAASGEVVSGPGSPEGISAQRIRAVQNQLKAGVNCPESSGMGRLFDGAAAILGICRNASYEGRGAVLLEAAARGCETKESYPFEIYADAAGVYRMDTRELIRSLVKESREGLISGGNIREGSICSEKGREGSISRAYLSAKFMNTLCRFAAEMTARLAKEHEFHKIVLSGGSFQNRYLLTAIRDELTRMGFEVYIHRQVSPNDEGLSLGQLMAARARL